MLPSTERESEYLPRYLDAEIEEPLAGLPTLAIDGPKAVGKTETAMRSCGWILRMYVRPMNWTLLGCSAREASVRG